MKIQGFILIATMVLSTFAGAQQSSESTSGNDLSTANSGTSGHLLICANPTGKAATPGKRFIDCHDGTLFDTTTGLTWELKDTKCYTGDLHCVSNTYTWSSNGTKRDGTVYTVFLAELNSDSVPFSATQAFDSENPGAGCFANHCDWRLPNIAELATIRDIDQSTAPGCLADHKAGYMPCIDQAAFDRTGYGTAMNFYLASSSYLDFPPGSFGNPDKVVWGVYFNNGFIGLGYKTLGYSVRAVRGGG